MLRTLTQILVVIVSTSTIAQSQLVDMKLLQTFRDEFIEITPGKKSYPSMFLFSVDSNQHALKQKFLIGKYEVTQELYAVVMEGNPSRWKGPRNSVENMTFADAQSFCKRITELLRKEKLITEQQQVRLPTELEWEYCCRAGTTTEYSFGDQAQVPGEKAPQASLLDPYAWHTGNAAGNDPPVGALKPNPWGLYDVHGYLWEYCASSDHTPQGKCVVRGGSWRESFKDLTCSSRKIWDLKAIRDDIGLRCVISN